jgi:dTDP-4-dehydrorhamnose reductase
VEKRKTILILGISSKVGINLAHYLSKEYRVIGTYFKNRMILNDILTFRLDINDKASLQTIVGTFLPEAIIYCVGESSINYCHENVKATEALNLTGAVNVVAIAERYRSRLIYLSTAFVFSGEEGGYKENHSTLPINYYGMQKASAEFYIQKNSLDYLILRTCLIFGLSFSSSKLSFLEYCEYNLNEGKSFDVDDVVQSGFLSCFWLARIISESIKQNTYNRLFHFSSSETLNHFEFAKIYAELKGYDATLIQGKKMNFPVDESKFYISGGTGLFDFSLDVSNIEETFNFKIPTIKEMLAVFLKDLGFRPKRSDEKLTKSSIEYI